MYTSPVTNTQSGLAMFNETTLRATGQLITGTVTYSKTNVASGLATDNTVTLNNNVGGFSLVYLALIILALVSFFVGLIAAFSAAWWMGVICLVVPPLASINGLVYIGTWGAVNLAAKLVTLIVGGKVTALVAAWVA